MGELDTTIRRADPIEYLMRRKFGNTSIGNIYKSASPIELPPSKSIEFHTDQESYCRELNNKSKEEIQKLVSEEEAKDQAEREKYFFFNLPNATANLQNYHKLPQWKPEEAVALSLGRDPQIVNWKALNSYRYSGTELYKQYKSRMELLNRCIEVGKMPAMPTPLEFVTWAKENDLTLPTELKELVLKKWGNLIDWKGKYKKIESKYEVLLKEITLLRATFENLKDPGERSKTTYLNIIGGLLHILLEKPEGKQPFSVFKTQSDIIEMMLALHEGKDGISQRTLEAKFAEANKIMNSIPS